MCYGMGCPMENYQGLCTCRHDQIPCCVNECLVCKHRDNDTDDCLRELDGLDCEFEER